ncbi:unnamed protein product [Rhodiola kirilowii]
MEAELMASINQSVCAYNNQERRRCTSNRKASCNLGARERKIVCVTSANSHLSSLIVKELLGHGYLVRVTLQHHVDFEEMKLLISQEEMNQLENVMVAKMGDVEALCEAFRSCHAIFHTSSFIDPHGLSGYSERMAFLETEASKNVIEACARTAYVKRCIFTSSLLASVWNDSDSTDVVIDEACWSDEDFCYENKLWLALGKTRAEKTAWIKAKELKVKLVTICPGFFMPPLSPATHPATSIPYLKGSSAMLHKGLLAVDDIEKLAKAHVCVYEEMDYGASGRYLSFEKVIRGSYEAGQLEDKLKVHGLVLRKGVEGDSETESRLSNERLTQLVARAHSRSCRQ